MSAARKVAWRVIVKVRWSSVARWSSEVRSCAGSEPDWATQEIVIAGLVSPGRAGRGRKGRCGVREERGRVVLGGMGGASGE